MKETVLNQKAPLSSQTPKRVILVEMFRAGPQISSAGQKLVFTESDLDQVVGSYDPQHHEAPLIIGHEQQDDTPSLGWVRQVWRKGKELWGKVELTPKAEQLIKDGVFKKVSSSFYLPEAETNPTPGKLSLRHLGLVPIPAVKGLAAFSEITEQQTITIVPSEGESSISFKEHLGKNQTMARKKTKPETPTSVASVEHTEGGGMTVNINIGPGSADKAKANIYDDNGNQISETGAPAGYDMEYGGADSSMMPPEMADGPSDDLGLEDDPTSEDGGDMPDDSGSEDPMADDSGMEDSAPPSGEDGDSAPSDPGQEPTDNGGSAPDDGTNDISGEMENSDQKIAQLASEYEIDELIKALALKTDAASMMEGEGMSYGEMPEGLKKAMEEKKDGEGEGEKEDEKETIDHEEKEDEEKDSEDMGETVPGAEEPSGAGEPPSEKVSEGEKPSSEQVYAEDEPSCSEEEEKKEEFEEGTPSKEATGTLDHSESAMGVQGQNDLSARVAELEEELARQRKLMREKEISDFCETLYDSGKLTQQIVSKTDLVRFMETLNSKNSVNFSEAGKASQFDFFKGVLDKLPSMVSFEEFATPASAPKAKKPPMPSADGYVYDPATAELHVQALEYSEAKGVDYTTALKVVISNNS